MSPRKKPAAPTVAEPGSATLDATFAPGALPTPMTEPPPSTPAGADGLTGSETVASEVRRRVIVEAFKVPTAARTTIRRLLPDAAAETDRVYVGLLGADGPDDDPEFPAAPIADGGGARVFYSLEVTEDERAELDAHPTVVGARPAPLARVI